MKLSTEGKQISPTNTKCKAYRNKGLQRMTDEPQKKITETDHTESNDYGFSEEAK